MSELFEQYKTAIVEWADGKGHNLYQLMVEHEWTNDKDQWNAAIASLKEEGRY
jgi:hypothetical protein